MASRAGTAYSSTRSTKSEVLLVCQSCSKKYTAPNASGLHVCSECVARGGPPTDLNKGPVERPRGIICYVCGREFFEKSIKIHIPQCLKKRAIEQAKLPPHLRTTLKEPAALAEAALSNKKLSLDETNELAFAAYSASMAECEYCGRTFSGQDRLAIHQRSCNEYTPARKSLRAGATAAGNGIDKLADTFPPATPSVRQSMPLPSGISRGLAVPASGGARPNTAPASRPQTSGPASVQWSDEPRKSPRTLAPLRSPSSGSTGSAGGGGDRSPGGGSSIGDRPGSAVARHPSAVPPDDSPASDGGLVPCGKCGRKFAPNRLGKHEDVCKGPAPSPARRAPPTAAAAPAQSAASKSSAAKDDAPSKWQVESMQLQQAMKAMRAYNRGETPPAPPAALAKANDGLVACPHCARRFNAIAAERHIPICSNVVNKPKAAHKTAQLSDTQIEYRARREGKPVPAAVAASISRSSYVPVPSTPAAKGHLPGISRSTTPAVSAGRSSSGPAFCGSCGTRFAAGAVVQFCTQCGAHR